MKTFNFYQNLHIFRKNPKNLAEPYTGLYKFAKSVITAHYTVYTNLQNHCTSYRTGLNKCAKSLRPILAFECLQNDFTL